MRKTGLFAFLLLTGCITHPPVHPLRPLEIATAPYQWVATRALNGSLMYEGGCLLFHDEGSGAVVMPVWPWGSSFNGTAVMFHRPSKADEWVMVNEQLLLSGQPLQWSTLATPYYQPFQGQCGAYPPFFVTAVRPAD